MTTRGPDRATSTAGSGGAFASDLVPCEPSVWSDGDRLVAPDDRLSLGTSDVVPLMKGEMLYAGAPQRL